jgi:hypothetical protein
MIGFVMARMRILAAEARNARIAEDSLLGDELARSGEEQDDRADAEAIESVDTQQ